MKNSLRSRILSYLKKPEGYSRMTARLALSYSAFLLLCLLLGSWLYVSQANGARQSYWQQRQAMLQNTVTEMDDRLATIEGYARQLCIDGALMRMAQSTGKDDNAFYLTASTMMQVMDSRFFSLSNLPVDWYYIYLRNSQYILSNSEFGSADLFYRRYRTFTPELYDDWLAMLENETGHGTLVYVTPYTNHEETYMSLWDMRDLTHRPIQATLCVEWDIAALKRELLPQDAPWATLTVDSSDTLEPMRLTAGQPEGKAQELTAVSALNGWRYALSVPSAMCDAAMDAHPGIFLALLCVAALLGGGMVTLLVKQNMKPVRQLGSRLSEALAGRESLEEDLERQRPYLSLSYTRRLLTGHIASEQELDHMLSFLELSGAKRYCVLYIIMYQSVEGAESADRDVRRDLNAILFDAIARHMSTDYPAHWYNATEKVYVVLTAFGDEHADVLMELQRRFLALHNELIERHALWAYSGVGMPCARALNAWESYEQARTAARYTARNHTFLPYEMIQKDSNAIYYPAEISVKLLHFITSGNRAQVVEMFDLIHRENVVERSLPLNLFDFLLSDLRNTLLKARFHMQSMTDDQQSRLAALDERFAEPLTFGQCESIALQLCDIFSAPVPASDPIPAVEQFIRENYQDPSICLNMLSDKFHISESYLSHLFKEKTGVNFSIYLEDLRLGEAARRLKEGDAVISEIYLDVGYTNATSFRRAFKKKYGVTPSTLRA